MPGKSETLPVVDVHAHLIHLDRGRLEAIQGIDCIDGKYMQVDGQPLKLQALYEPETLIGWMNSQGIDSALISTPPFLYRQQLDEDRSKEWVSYVNDGLEAIAAQYPDRLKVLAHLPLEHPETAASEASRRQGRYYGGFSIAAGASAF